MFQCPSFLRQLFRLFCLGLILFLGNCGGDLTHQYVAQAVEPQSLYERLGGYDTNSEIIDEFLKKNDC